MNQFEFMVWRRVFGSERYIPKTKFFIRIGSAGYQKSEIKGVLKRWENRGLVRTDKRFVERLVDL